MSKQNVIRLLCCLVILSVYFYLVIQKQNSVNYLSLQIPKLQKDLKTLEEENLKLQFESDCFESPDHLMQLVKKEGFTHLRYPIIKDVLSVPEGLALQLENQEPNKTFRRFKTEPVLAVGASRP